MKKLFFPVLILCAVLLNSCASYFEDLAATVTVINETDEKYYFIAYYNGTSGDTVGVRNIEPHSEITFETAEGIYNKANLKNTDDFFLFYYCNEASWEEDVGEEYQRWLSERDLDSAIFLFHQHTNDGHIDVHGKQSQNYTIKFSPQEDNVSVDVTWK